MSNIQRYRLDNGILRDSHGDRVYMLPGDLILDSSLADAHKEAEIAALEWAWVMVSGCGVKGRLDKLKERP